ncbi:MAG: sulfite exporter TauE/SafE family protein [Pseudomonadota bacterium]
MDPMTLLPIAVLLMAIGAFAGVLAGLLGVGGGIVLVPAFLYAFRATGFAGPDVMQVCVATSLATVVVTSLRSVSSHNKKGAVDWDILRAWAPALAVGAALGVLVAANLRSEALQLIFGVLAMVVGLYMALGREHWRLGASLPMGWLGRAIGFVMGLLSVLMGIGGGSFGVPTMALYGVPIHRAVATAAGFGVAIAAPSVIGFLFVSVDAATRPPATIGAINLIGFAIIVPMTILTAPWGVKLAHSLPSGRLKRVFGFFLLLVAANMAWEVLAP